MTQPHALIIEDDPNSIDVLGRLLRNEGVSFTAVQDSTIVAEVIKHFERLDVVFLDLEMPKLNGYQLFERLQNLIDARVPIIACSVHTNEIETVHGLGFDGFLGKPLNIARFPEQIRQILNHEPIWEV